MKKIIAAICLLTFSTFAFAVERYQAGVDYQIIPASPALPATSKNKVDVIEFFSYGCPACFALESKLKQWLRSKPADVNFNRIPVVFHPNWQYYAKAFYTAQALNISDKIDTAMFVAIQVGRQPMTSNKALIELFTDNGVNADTAENAISNSPSIDAKIAHGTELMRAYQVFGVPAMVIDGKYRVDAKTVNGDMNKLFDVVDFLISKARNR